MENKVIIDGIDVSECKHLKYDGIKKPICRSGGCTSVYKNCLCIENKDCDYKQLKRLQAENEKLKQVANDSIIEQEKLIAKVNELQAENERLKEENDNYAIQLGVLAQALQEIRDIAKETIGNRDPYIRMYAGEMYCRPILDKINSVIGAEE